MKFAKEMLRLYAVTDRHWTGKRTLEEQIEEALQGGATLIQLREKNLSRAEFTAEAIRVRQLCHRYGVALIVNDDVDVALDSGADGVHVGAEDAPVAEIRQRAGADFIIGATAKTVEQARAAQAAGADYLGVGAVFPSPTKKNAVRITGEMLEEITSAVEIPCVAIGGINICNIEEIKGRGAAGVAVVSAVFGAEDIRAACAALRKKAEEMEV